MRGKALKPVARWFLGRGAPHQPPNLSPALAAQHEDDQAVSGDAQGEDEGVDHRQEDLLEVSGHHVLHVTRLLQIRQVTGTRT